MNKILRIYFGTDQQTNRKFYWFEMDELDFYWGSSTKTKEAYCELESTNNTSFTIQTPKDFKTLDFSQSKYSFHESGTFHIKKLKENKYEGKDMVSLWSKKSDLTEPFRIFSLITKPFVNYPIETKKIPRKNTSAITIQLDGEASNNRLFLEIFLCKPGEYKNPKPLVNFGTQNQIRHFHKFTPEFTLMLRYTKLEKLDHWFGDTELIFVEKRHITSHKK